MASGAQPSTANAIPSEITNLQSKAIDSKLKSTVSTVVDDKQEREKEWEERWKPFVKKIPSVQLKCVNQALLRYANHILNNCSPPEVEPVSLYVKEKDQVRQTASSANMCVSPLQAARGWGALSLSAEGKTKKAIEIMIGQVLNEPYRGRELHQFLLNLHLSVEKNSYVAQNCVKLFLEYQPVIPTKKHVQADLELYYNNNMDSTALQRICFSGDDDGVSSMHRINLLVSKATADQIRYVVREECPPSRRAQIVVVTAIDCTFHWKSSGSLSDLKKFYFYDDLHKKSKNRTLVNGWIAEGDYRVATPSHGNTIVELESFAEGYKLYLIKSKNDDTIAPDDLLEAIDALEKKEKKSVKIAIPQFSIASPLKLYDCTNNYKKYGIGRIFDREKSELSGLIYRSHQLYPYYVTLWDHYHKASITITKDPPKNPAEIDAKNRKNLRLIGNPATPNTSACFNKYYEEHVPYIPDAYNKVSDGDGEEMQADIVFNTPFYFLVTRASNSLKVVHCYGRFNNVECVYKTDNKKAGEV